ncbi:MAG: 5-(carboxyamino)imidazole ribonucleotide synthase [Candidatus Nanopelagicaceae bacterium]|nr:5-(carboxyamino)imidazole ribonucleotide synthase [Candidatus Nanopelagicaceae bacterium]
MKTFPRVGVIGSGQLAQMTLAPAAALGIELVTLANSSEDSAAQSSPHVVGDFKDIETVRKFAASCDVVTFEHELIPISIIRTLESEGVKFLPSSNAFQYSQDKALMRAKLSHLPNPKWQVVTEAPEWNYPAIAKSISGGYDGRGVWKVNSKAELIELLKEVPKILLEELIEFDFEIAVMVARSPHGQAATWAPTRTVQRDGICIETVTPVPEFSASQSEAAQNLALQIAEEIKLVGVMAVEIFVKGDELLINELALRPHNSGHWTIEGSVTSQFEQHLRAILDLPLGETSMVANWAVMGNILGGSKSDMYRPYLHLMARTPALKFHHYRKEVRPGRKIGHVTITGDNLVELRSEIDHALAYMSGEIDE